MTSVVPLLDTESDKNDSSKPLPGWAVALVVVWVALGVLAHVMAFRCSSSQHQGGDARKVIMFLLAGILGPLWFLVYALAGDNYCKMK